MTARRRSLPTLEISFDEPAWRNHRAISGRIRKAVESALRHAARGSPRSLTILLSNDRYLRELNGVYRGKDKPTNVLSFPSAQESGYLGDIAIAYGVVEREAAESGKLFTDHAAHLVVHGVLHLLGYDHETARDATSMEALEIEILAKMGIANPYEMPTD